MKPEKKKRLFEGGMNDIMGLPISQYAVEELTPTQFRINGVIDCYPISKRMAVLKINRWFEWKSGKLQEMMSELERKFDL